ncbi:hypothetical protein B0H21DRAFT_884840 [Amylocystis lapponica]|nr:hypothetical protein B0H21DRAFT_884840 [Amylocystis lapponica]
MAPTRAQLQTSAQALCSAFAAKADPDRLLSHFSTTHEISAIEHGEPLLAPFLGREFIGRSGAASVLAYFTLLTQYLTYDKMLFEEWVIDTDALKDGKVTNYQVWADSGAAYLACRGELSAKRKVGVFVSQLEHKDLPAYEEKEGGAYTTPSRRRAHVQFILLVYSQFLVLTIFGIYGSADAASNSASRSQTSGSLRYAQDNAWSNAQRLANGLPPSAPNTESRPPSVLDVQRLLPPITYTGHFGVRSSSGKFLGYLSGTSAGIGGLTTPGSPNQLFVVSPKSLQARTRKTFASPTRHFLPRISVPRAPSRSAQPQPTPWSLATSQKQQPFRPHLRQ